MNKKYSFKNKVIFYSVPFALGLGLVTLSPLANVHADTNVSVQNQAPTDQQQIDTTNSNPSGLTAKVTATANNYISIDHSTKRFIVSNDIYNELTPEQVESVKNQVNEANNAIANTNSKDAVLDTSNGDQVPLSNRSPYIINMRAGYTSVHFYWNYVHVTLSANGLKHAISAGFNAGSVYVPVKAVAVACSIAGITTNYMYIRDGIWFNFNYYSQVITAAGFQ